MHRKNEKIQVYQYSRNIKSTVMYVTLKPMMKILRVSRTVRHTSVAMLASSNE